MVNNGVTAAAKDCVTLLSSLLAHPNFVGFALGLAVQLGRDELELIPYEDN